MLAKSQFRYFAHMLFSVKMIFLYCTYLHVHGCTCIAMYAFFQEKTVVAICKYSSEHVYHTWLMGRFLLGTYPGQLDSESFVHTLRTCMCVGFRIPLHQMPSKEQFSENSNNEAYLFAAWMVIMCSSVEVVHQWNIHRYVCKFVKRLPTVEQHVHLHCEYKSVVVD